MLKLHIWRCTADVKACREYYGALTEPSGVYLERWCFMLAKQAARYVLVQPNTFIRDGEVVLREHDASVEGVVRIWAERVPMIDEDAELYNARLRR
jgi:dipeptidyl-peptidase-3